MKAAITRWLIWSECVLAVAVLCSCAASPTSPTGPTTYTPVQNPAQTMSVEEARRVVLAEAVPPVYFFNSRDDSIALDKPIYMISNVYIRKTTIRILTGYKAYNISLTDINPLISRDDSDGQKYADVYIAITGYRQGFFTNLTFVNSAGYRAGLYDSDRATRFADALLVLKLAAVKFAEADEALFQQAAHEYRAVATKPELPEAARRFKVQAEGAVGDKDLDGAAEYYEKAIDIAPWWPGGHFNRALVLSQAGGFSDAITEMKRYLELVPGAPDARDAQDKIYDWERKVK